MNQPSSSRPVVLSQIARFVLGTLAALARDDREVRLPSLRALIPADACTIDAAIDELRAACLVARGLDDDDVRLTLRGLAFAHAPKPVAYERRRRDLGGLRKAVRSVA